MRQSRLQNMIAFDVTCWYTLIANQIFLLPGQLEKIYNDLFQKMLKLEEEKYDINYAVSTKDAEV